MDLESLFLKIFERGHSFWDVLILGFILCVLAFIKIMPDRIRAKAEELKAKREHENDAIVHFTQMIEMLKEELAGTKLELRLTAEALEVMQEKYNRLNGIVDEIKLSIQMNCPHDGANGCYLRKIVVKN